MRRLGLLGLWLGCSLGVAGPATAGHPLEPEGPQTADTLGPIDLNGDRKREQVRQTDAGVVIGRTTIPCGSRSEPCELALHDIVPTDRLKELSVCSPQPPPQRSCTLVRPRAAGVVRLELAVHPSVRGQADRYAGGRLHVGGFATRGDGGVEAEVWDPVCPRTERFEAVERRLEHRPRVLYECRARSVVVDAGLTLVDAPTSARVTLELPAGTRVEVWQESGRTPHWYLVRASDGSLGWVSRADLARASSEVAALLR